MGFFRKLFGLGAPKKTIVVVEEVIYENTNEGHERAEISEEARLVYENQKDPLYQERLECGFLIGEIILLYWLNNKKMSASYPEYFEYVYEINPFKSTRDFLAHDYIKISDPYESLDGLIIPDLKAILRNEKLPVSGKKELLISRIKDNLSLEQVGRYVKDKFYTLTDNGVSVVESHGYIVFAHTNITSIYTPAEAIRFMSENKLEHASVEQFNNLMIMNSIKEEYENYKNYGIMRNGFHELSKVQKKFKHTDNSIISLLCMFIFDVSGWGNGGDYHENNVFDERSATIAPRLIGKKIDSVRLEGYFNKAWSMTEQFFPRHYLGKEKSFECLIAGFENDIPTIRKLLNLDNRQERDFGSYRRW